MLGKWCQRPQRNEVPTEGMKQGEDYDMPLIWGDIHLHFLKLNYVFKQDCSAEQHHKLIVFL